MKTVSRYLLVALALATALSGCSKKDEYTHAASSGSEDAMSAPAPAAEMSPKSMSRAGGGASADAAQASEPAARRYIALSHQIVMRTDAEKVEAAWRAAVKACEAAGCELLSSSLARENAAQAPQASLDARIAPDKLDGFIKQISGLGTIGRHDTSAEDKTDQVVDTEARQKNQTELRDRLRQLLATPGAKLADIMAVEETLARVQSELDALSTLRKVLANETEKVRVSVTIEPRASITRPATWQPLAGALDEAGYTLSTSLAALLTFIVSALPWALLGAVVLAVFKASRRRRAAKRPD